MQETLLEHLRKTKAEGCQRCRLRFKRNCLVFGIGDPNAKIILVGEAPGTEENKTGEPFTGPAGKLLDGFLSRVNLSREDVYILNVVKCWPPDNRDPEPDEIAACTPFLHTQIRIVSPRVIVALGRIAGATLGGYPLSTSVTWLRNQDLEYKNELTGIACPLVVTYHPSYILRNINSNPRVAKSGAKDLVADLQRAKSWL